MAEKYISKSSAIAARLLGDEMMIMSAVDSTFFTLDEVATVIYKQPRRTPLHRLLTRFACNSTSTRNKPSATQNNLSMN